MVRGIENLQTFLTAAEVDRLVDDYLDGAMVNELADRYGVHRATVSAHLTRRRVGRRRPGWEWMKRQRCAAPSRRCLGAGDRAEHGRGSQGRAACAGRIQCDRGARMSRYREGPERSPWGQAAPPPVFHMDT